jgi:hypothetical protein
MAIKLIGELIPIFDISLLQSELLGTDSFSTEYCIMSNRLDRFVAYGRIAYYKLNSYIAGLN